MKPVSDLSALTFENLQLRLQVIQGQLQALEHAGRQIQQQGQAFLEAMRVEVGADPAALYDPPTKTFVLPTGPRPLQAPASRQVRRAAARKDAAG